MLDAEDGEVPLEGGRITAGIVRVGNTVRRPGTASSAFINGLLRSLADAGFDGCPRYLGQDSQGRDILSYVPGKVPHRWRRFGDTDVGAAARLLRRFHDASRSLAAELGAGVVCHNDVGPNNVVFRSGVPIAFIDFDFAAPGDPLEDVGYMAWAWCISSRPDRGPVTEQARQVRMLADSYGLESADRGRLSAAIDERLHRNETFWRGVRATGEPPTITRAKVDEVIAWTLREMAFFAEHQAAFEAALARR